MGRSSSGRVRVGVRATAVGVLALGLLAGCGSGAKKPGGTVTVTVPPSTSAGTSSGTSTAAGTGTATPPPSTQAHLGGSCYSLLPDVLVTQALGVTQLAGADAFVVGLPDKTIGKLSTINCRYGVTGTGASAKAKVEIGVSLYSTPAQAAARIQATADDYTTHGATSSNTSVDGHPAVVLTGGTGAGYDVPLLAVAAGQRTVAVSIEPSVTKSPKAAEAVASLALKRTTG